MTSAFEITSRSHSFSRYVDVFCGDLKLEYVRSVDAITGRGVQLLTENGKPRVNRTIGDFDCAPCNVERIRLRRAAPSVAREDFNAFVKALPTDASVRFEA